MIFFVTFLAITYSNNKLKYKTMKKLKNQGFIQFVLLLSALLFYGLESKAQKSTTLTDPEIASVAVTANQIDIDYANIALLRSKNAEVLNFAHTMANDHKAIIDQAVALVTKLGVTPKTNAVTKSLLDGEKTTIKKLKAKKGVAFDKAYISNEVAYHKAVIGAVETLLIPQAKNAELKALLVKVMPALKEHLAHAEMLNKSINK